MRIRSRFAGGAHYYIFASLSLLDLRERPNHESLERRTLSLNQEDLSGRRDSLPQDRPDIKQAREEWTLTRQPIMRLEPHRLVFLDETGTTTKMARLRGRSLRGQRLLSKVPFGHCKTQTFIAGLRCDALTAPFVIDAPMDQRIFETYVETQLVPTLRPGDVVVLVL
jgi:hypothetical protein